MYGLWKAIQKINSGDFMKKTGLICAALLAGVSLAACSNQQSENTKTSNDSSLKAENSSLKNQLSKKHRQTKKKKQSHDNQSSTSSNSNDNSSNQQSSTQVSSTQHASTVQNNNQRQAPAQSQQTTPSQDQRPDDVPSNFKEYTSYTTDGHKMTQWNDAGSYCGDPETQYETNIKMSQAEERIANGQVP